MANELQITITQFQFQKGSTGVGTVPGQRQYSVSGLNGVEQQGTVGTTDVLLSKGPVASIGWVWAENTNQAGTDALTIGSDGTNYPIQFLPGEGGCFRWNQPNFHIKGGALNVGYYIIFVDA
jgi:hypothetical protein